MASATTAHGADTHMGRTFAQWYCLLAGATLLLAGVLGFIADSGFDTGNGIQGDKLILFEVNGWHNLVHIASGLVLLAAANSRPTAKTVAIAFGVVYGLVTIIGIIDGEDVFGLLPVNGPDNVLHLLLSAAGIAAGLMSPTTKRQQADRKKGVDARTSGGTSAGNARTSVGSGTDSDRLSSGRFDPSSSSSREGERTR